MLIEKYMQDIQNKVQMKVLTRKKMKYHLMKVEKQIILQKMEILLIMNRVKEINNQKKCVK